MVRHYIWGPHPDDGVEQGHIVMSTEDAGGRRKPDQPVRPGHVPVFRPGNRAPSQPITLDQRTGREIFMAPMVVPPVNPLQVWESIPEIALTPEILSRNGLFADAAQNAVTQIFDMLRTRVLQAMAARSWTRIAVTSPTHGCGKSFVAANLALSLARLPSCRTVLMDLELREPQLAPLFDQSGTGPLIDYLMGARTLEQHFGRIGRNLALALNGEAVPRAAELLQDPEFARALEQMRDLLQPDVVIMDTPPALALDDVLSLAPHVDAIILVTDGTLSTPDDIRACERLFDGRIPILGVVLNRAQDRSMDRYAYGQRG
jgi:protein-tyrosine kinase